MKIKIFEKTPGCMPKILEQGDWIDLHTAKEIKLIAPEVTKLRFRRINDETNKQDSLRNVTFDSQLIPLGVCMQIPKGFEAHILPRSSTFKNFGLIQTNSQGIIDYTYCSEQDEWKMPVMATKSIVIPKGTRIAQFRIVPSQKASFWQKLKWLFSSKINLVKVNSLNNNTRGGFGSKGN